MMKSNPIKSCVLLLLTLCLLAGAWVTPVSAEETSAFRPMTTVLPMVSLAENGVSAPLDGTVELINGTAAAWIDRATLPDIIRDFYDLLVEGSDNDGVEDILIEDRYYQDADYTIEIATERHALNGRTAEAVVDEVEAKYMSYLYTVFGAFDRDHPEVFWLSNAWQTGSFYFYDSTTCTVTILVGIRQIRASSYQTEASIKSAIQRRDAAITEICKDFTWETTAYERIVHFNRVLTETNQYNTSQNLNAIAHDCRECISALDGRTGTSGPVCEGYARAFKVLCDASGIPCVLVDGIGKSSPSSSEGHMWNSVEVDGVWYGVDVTWNDPAASSAMGALSGYESEDWLLVGSSTVINGRAFSDSHLMRNQVYSDFLGFTNGPTESTTAYKASLMTALNLPQGGYVYDGTEKCPQVVVKYNGTTLNADTDYTVIYENNRNAGTATVRVAGKGWYRQLSTSTTFEIGKRALTPTISVKDKMYDGTTAAEVTVILPQQEIIVGDAPSVQGTGTFESADAADDVRILWDLSLTGTGSENYSLNLSEEVTANIDRRPVTVYATKTALGEEDAIELTYTVDPETPLVEGERLSGVLNFVSEGKKGVYTITAGTLTDANNPNYHITFVPATLTIGEVETENEGTEDPLPSRPIQKDPAEELITLLSENPLLVGAVVGGAGLAVALITLVALLARKRR